MGQQRGVMPARTAGVALAMVRFIVLVCAVLLPVAMQAQAVRAGRVVSDSLWSYALGTYKSVVVYLPPSYEQSKARYPVVYYLHGWSGDETNWTKAGHIDASMDTLVARGLREMIVVMPDGDDSWWMTSESLPDMAGCERTLPSYARDAKSYCVPWPHYDDYVAYDLVRWTDTRFRTIADRAHRGIAGLSMGGYGALTLALRFPLIFSAAASHSGVVWPLEWAQDGIYQRPAGTSDSLWARNRRGSVDQSMVAVFGRDTIAWYAKDPVHMVDRLLAAGTPIPALMADCGTEDVYVHGNRALRDALERRRVALAYAEHPGAHNWAYWRTYARESLQWFANRFTSP